MVGIPEMVDSVNALILADRRVTIEDISEQLGISVGIAHKIILDACLFYDHQNDLHHVKSLIYTWSSYNVYDDHVYINDLT